MGSRSFGFTYFIVLNPAIYKIFAHYMFYEVVLILGLAFVDHSYTSGSYCLQVCTAIC